MYTQFFGNFLLSKGYITNEQLFDALKEKSIHDYCSNLIIIHSMIRAQKEHLQTADVLLCCAIYNYISDQLQLYD